MARNKFILFTSVLLALVGAQGLFADQLVTNGGFETGDFTGWSVTGPAATSFPPSYGLVTPSPLGLVATGNYAAFLSNNLFGPNRLILGQNLTVVPGNSYTVSYSFLSGSSYVSNLPNGFQVTFAGSTLFSQTNTPAVVSYSNYSFLVTIPTTGSTSAELDFNSYADSGAFYLDNVSVSTASPEPATFFLLAPVLGGLALLRRKRSCLQSIR